MVFFAVNVAENYPVPYFIYLYKNRRFDTILCDKTDGYALD